MKVQILDTAFKGIEGYHHTKIVEFATVCAMGICNDIMKAEQIISLGMTFQNGQYQITKVAG